MKLIVKRKERLESKFIMNIFESFKFFFGEISGLLTLCSIERSETEAERREGGGGVSVG